MRGRLVDMSIGLNRKYRVTVEVDRDFREDFEKLKGQELDVDIRKHRDKRSKTANAYFHVLVNKIAAVRGGSDEDGFTAGLKLPVAVDPDTVYPYVKWFDTREENGRMFNCYLMYKQTRFMDSKEMARLIDGAIEVAKELGIETDTPEQLARYKEVWSRQ